MDLQPNLESILFKVNNFINIDEHRQIYTDHFNNLRNNIFNNLKANKVFCYMFNGFQLGGSYGDNVKVSLPNEFDLVFHITFPEQSLINVVKDDDLPGNVYLDFTKVLLKINNQKQHEQNLKHLKQWVDGKNYLKIEKFQLFIQQCFNDALSEMNKKITYNGKTSFLRYKREGPAHTIHVESLNCNYSVDFVPGILLSAEQSVVPNTEGKWDAIPKPSKTNHHNYKSFRSSYYQQERKIIQNKHQLKNAFRMLKKYRDNKTNLNKLKSYFIKTLFLFKASRENSKYWTRTLSEIIIDMFKDLENSLREGNLPFFWDTNLNLYQCYSEMLLREMLSCVERSRETLEKAAKQLTIPLQNRVYCIFLNKTERNSLEKEDNLSLKNGYIKEALQLNSKCDDTNEISTELIEDDVTEEALNGEQKNANKFSCILS